MIDAENQLPVLERLPSGIPGLDRILHGGFFKGDSYIIVGPPGAGKTILANQLCFHHIATGGRALYISLLAETSSRMLAHMQSFRFLTLAPIAETIHYLSGYAVLEQEGLAGLMNLLQSEMRRQRATMLVIDGTVTAEQVAPTPAEWKHFLHELHVASEFLGCTTFLLMQPDFSLTPRAEETMVDGVLELSTRSADIRIVRQAQIRKFRGSDFLSGQHLYTISTDGITIYPRTETILALSQADLPTSPSTQAHLPRLNTGIAGLDEMLRGGLPPNSTTLLLGASGTGKTLLGSHFLYQGAAQGQPALHFGFYETPTQLMSKMNRFDLQINRFVEQGQLTLLWQPPLQDLLDPLAERLLETVQLLGVRRLFLDGLGGFQRTVASTERLDLFFTALFTTLHILNVTTICSVELPDLFSPTLVPPTTLIGTTALVENILFLRHVELRSQLYRLISILKVRESGYDSSIREFRISRKGIEVASTFESAEDILTGLARSPARRPNAPSAFEASPSDGEGQQP